jgi:hypothetical protein
MAKWSFLIGTVLLLLVTVQPLMADDSTKDSPWKKLSFDVGAFFAASETTLRFGSSVGTTVDLGEILGMDTVNRVFRLGAYWRFTDNLRHRLDLSWFSFNLTGDKTITDQIIIEPPGGGEDIIIDPGTEVKSYLDLDIFQLNYSYSFIQDDRLDFCGQVGLYLMPMSFGLSATGLVETEGDQSFTAPMPVIGLRFDVLIAPKWYLRSGSQIFYVSYGDYTGSLLNFRTAIEYNPWKNIGFGLGFDALRLMVEADGDEAIPGMDLRGNVNFGYNGAMLYGRVFF